MRPELPDLSSPSKDPPAWPRSLLLFTLGRHFAGAGAFDVPVKILNAYFEKRAPWPNLIESQRTGRMCEMDGLVLLSLRSCRRENLLRNTEFGKKKPAGSHMVKLLVQNADPVFFHDL